MMFYVDGNGRTMAVPDVGGPIPAEQYFEGQTTVGPITYEVRKPGDPEREVLPGPDREHPNPLLEAQIRDGVVHIIG